MTFDNIVGFFKKTFPELTITSTPADDIVDAEIVLQHTPFTVVVYDSKCSVTWIYKKNGDVYFQHPLVGVQPLEAAEYIREKLS